MMTKRLMVKVNYKPDAHINGKFDVQTTIHKKLDQKHQRYGELCKNQKTPPVLSSLNTKIPGNNGKFNC